MGDQQLEVLDQAENLEMVKEVIVLVQRTRAKHVGALIEAAEPGSDLAGLLISVGAELMAQEELPNPQAEWEDALLKIEIDNLKREQNELINQSDNNFQISEKYRELSRRLSRLINVVNANRSK
jgi:DNA primase